MRRVLLTTAACALAALAVAGCEPPVEQSAYNNSGLSAAVAFDPSAAPKPPENPPPRIEPPAQQAAASPAPTKG
jgi:hypothetical protein